MSGSLNMSIERILILEDTDIIKKNNLPSYIIQQQGDQQLFPEEPITLSELEKKIYRFYSEKDEREKNRSGQNPGHQS